MSDTIVNTSDYQVIQQQQRDISFAKRMALSKEWEKVFLDKDEELRQSKGEANDPAVTDGEAESPQPEKTGTNEYVFDVTSPQEIGLNKSNSPEVSQAHTTLCTTNGIEQNKSAEMQNNLQARDMILDVSSKPIARNIINKTGALPMLQNPAMQQTGNYLSKTGLHVVSTEDGYVKVWLRDNSVTAEAGSAILASLRSALNKMGVRLAAFTLNGKLMFEKQNAANAEQEAGQLEADLKLYKSF